MSVDWRLLWQRTFNDAGTGACGGGFGGGPLRNAELLARCAEVIRSVLSESKFPLSSGSRNASSHRVTIPRAGR